MAQQNIIIGAANAQAGDTLFSAFTKTEANFTELFNLGTLTGRVVVKQASDFGVIDSTKEYFLDGIIDFTGTGLSIEVPSGGIYITGYNFDTSGIKCTDAAFTLFSSPIGGSGNLLFKDFLIDIQGTGSQVYNLVGDTGFEAIEIDRINFNNCTSLGTVSTYRQGLETGTGRFGGTPELTLAGTWVGGYFIDTSIIRSLSNSAFSIYKAGAGFVMGSRFRSNQNIDLPALANFLDFAPANFTNPSTLQLEQCLITRNGVFDANDSNLTPNISASDLQSAWTGNTGLPNTFEGGSIGVTTTTTTTISVAGTFVDLEATLWTTSDLQHFDNPSGNQLRHLGNSPREYKIIANFTLESNANNELTFRITKWDDSASSFSTVLDQVRPVNNLQGGRDVAFFNVNINTELDQNDFIKLEVANNGATNNITAEADSYYVIEER